MPDDYYVSKYSGEEIDERLTAAHNAVRYDAAQTLTDAQKTQARANIAAAPSRFGLGENMTTGPLMQSLTEEALDTTYNNGWYFANGVNIAGFSQATIRVDSSGRTIYQTAYVAQRDGYVLRRCLVDTVESPPYNSFGPWEWVNPPMLLGVEYRTTERYFGKPVYVQAVNFGTLPNANTKSVTWATSGVVLAVLSVEATSNLGEPIGLGSSMSGTEITATTTTLYIKSSGDYSTNTAVFRVKYTKTTD